MKILKNILILSLFSLIGNSAIAEGIEFFHGTWKEALEQAKSEDKILFVDSYAQWCGPCKRMAKNVFTQAEVGDFFNNNFVNLKLDMETPDGRTFGKKYGVSAYPTLFFLGNDGQVVKKVKGGQQAASLIDHGKNAISGYDRSGEYEEKYLAGDRSYDLVHGYMTALAAAKKPHLKVANEYLRSEPEITAEQRNQFVFDASTEMDSNVFEEMIANKKDIISLVGEQAFDKKIKTACLSGVDKSIEFDYPELLEEAIDIAKNNLVEGNKLFEYEARVKYALTLNDMDTYLRNAKLLAKKSKYNGAVLNTIIKTVNEKFDTNPEAMKVGAEMVNKVLKYGDPSDSKLPVYVKVLTLGDKKKDAIKLIKKSQEKNADNATKSKKLDGILNYIENLEPLNS